MPKLDFRKVLFLVSYIQSLFSYFSELQGAWARANIARWAWKKSLDDYSNDNNFSERFRDKKWCFPRPNILHALARTGLVDTRPGYRPKPALYSVCLNDTLYGKCPTVYVSKAKKQWAA